MVWLGPQWCGLEDPTDSLFSTEAFYSTEGLGPAQISLVPKFQFFVLSVLLIPVILSFPRLQFIVHSYQLK